MTTTIRELALSLITRMIEIDSDLSAGMYPPEVVAAYHGFDRLERQDEPPTGDDYNLLWDALLDEIDAAFPELDLRHAETGLVAAQVKLRKMIS